MSSMRILLAIKQVFSALHTTLFDKETNKNWTLFCDLSRINTHTYWITSCFTIKHAINGANYQGTGIRICTYDKHFGWLSAHRSHDQPAEIKLAGVTQLTTFAKQLVLNSSSSRKMPEQVLKLLDQVNWWWKYTQDTFQLHLNILLSFTRLQGIWCEVYRELNLWRR